MSDQNPRIIEGLSPKTAPLARMRASERAAAPAPVEEKPIKAASAPERRPSPRRKPAAAPTANGVKKRSVSFYAPETLPPRARAAFVQTRHLEGDVSFSDMLAKALEAEVTRRERLYNDGKPFEDGGAPLTSGRPVQS